MRFSLKISVRSNTGRPHRPLVSGLVALATLSASGLVVVPVSARPAGPAAETRTRISAKDLPPLRSEAATPTKLDVPQGDFSNPPGNGDSAVAPDRRGVNAGATLVRRDGKSEIWDNKNGTSTAIVHAQPSAWRDRAGQTQAVDDRLVANGARFKNASGPVNFNLAGATGDGDLVTASGDGWSLGFSPADAAAGRTGQVDGSTIRYRQIAPDMDLEEKIEGQNLKETIILTKLPAPGSSGRFRFPLTLSGLTPRTNQDGSIGFVDASGAEVATMPQGIAFDSSGDPAQGTQASTPVHVALMKLGNGWAVDLSVSADWLTSPARVAPIFIDPNIVFNAGRDNGSTHTDAFVAQANPTTNYNGSAQLDAGAYVNKIGYASYPNGQYNAFTQYDVSALAGHSVVSATWNGYFLSAAAYPSTFAATKAAAAWSDSTITWNNQPGVTGSPVTESVTAANQWATADVTSWVQSWVTSPSSNYGMRIDSNGTNAYLRLTAMEQAGGQDSYIAVTFTNTAPAVPTQGDLSPANGASTTSLTPTLATAAKTDPDGDTVKYWFRVSTASDGESGQVLNSGWLTSPSYQVPPGVFQDGMTYSWKVSTWDGWGSQTPASWSPVNTLRVDQRLGGQGAVDTVGPVTVDLTTGNVATGFSSPTFNTVGGPIGLSYSYNSAAASPYGLSGAYYGSESPDTAEDCGTGASPAFPAEPLLVRQDSTVDFAWGNGSAAPAIGTDNFCVRWTGYLTVPTTATNWQIGATHDDGVRIYLNNEATPYLDQWVDGAGTQYGANRSLTGGVAVPITVEYYDNTGPANMTLLVAGPNIGPGNVPVPSNWLTQSTPAALPQGWQLSAGTQQSLMYTAARVGNDSLVLVNGEGGTSEYRRNGSRAFRPVGDAAAMVRQNVKDGTFSVLAEDGFTYLFSKSGKLISVTSASDDSNPARAVHTYNGNGQLTSISDPVSGRALTLRYGTDPACTTPPTGYDTAPPPGQLCGVGYPDGSKTSFYYSSGRLARVDDPGSSTPGAADSAPVTNFVYDSAGRLVKVRTPDLSDKVATNPAVLDNDTTRIVIAYDGNGRATSVTLPVPNAGETPAQPAPANSYRYVATNETQIDVAGLTPASGFARKVTFDPATGLVLTDTDATNRTTTTEWNAKRLPISTTDPAGLKTTTIYNSNDQPTDTYGPAAANCFTGQLPNSSCTAAIQMRSTTAGGNNGSDTTIVLNKPAGIQAGDVLIAAVAVRGVPTVTAPTGWTLIRSDSNGSSMKTLSYWRVATSSEPANWTWSFSSARAAAGTITAYTGVNTSNPVDVHSGFANTTDSTQILAPSVTTTGVNERLIGIFSIMKVTAIAPPTGMQELAETSANNGTDPPVAIEIADTTQGTAGASGDKIATAGTADRNTGQLLALSPAASGGAGVPHTTTAYDEGLQGLAGTYWPNKYQTGDPTYRSTGVGDATGALSKDWDAGAPGGLPTDNWSARFTGEILLPEAGQYTFQLDSDDGVALTIDGTELIYAWYNHNGWSPTATFTTTEANRRYPIQVDFYEATMNAEVHLYWTKPSGGGQVLVPGANLFPAYGLTTSTTDADGKQTSTQYSKGSIGPEYGLATATIADPGGLNLTTSTTYEAPSSSTFLRRTSRTLPNGSATTVNYAYYGTSGTADDPVTNTCGITSSTSQAGLLKEVTEADPDGAGGQAPIKRQFVYDQLGRRVGSTIVGDGYWSCTSYDARGRVTSISDPKLAAATTDYSTVGQITTSYTDSSGMARSTVAKVDLLGRPLSYSDELGTTTRAVYDQAGRVTATYRTFSGQTESQLTSVSYDDAGRPTSLTEYASGTGRTTTFGYDTAGRSQTMTRPNGVVTTTTYDPNSGGVVGLSNKQGGTTEISPWTYTRSAAGRVATESTTGRTRAFSYDAAGRLTTANENSGATIRNYAYDANTNRCGNASTCTTPTFTYDNADRITSSPYASAYVYDAHGNVISTTGTSGNPSMKFGYEANDHATVNNDGTTTTVATVAPTGRVLRRVVITNSTGVVSEDISFGYDGPGDSPAYQLPTPSTLGWPVIFNDAWTDTNGAGWDASKWVTTSNDSTKIADVQSNQGRLYVNGSPARATSQMTATADAEVNFTYRFNERTSGSFLRIFMRASGASGANQMPNAYRLEVASGTSTVKLQKFVNSVVTDIGSFTYTQDTNAQRVRFQVLGSTIRAKVWPVGSTEPASWSVTATDTAITGTGVIQVAHSHSSGAHTVYVDDLALSAPGPTSSAIVTTFVSGPAGLLVTDTGGTATYPISNVHGDIVGTTDAAGTYTANPSTDELGRGTTPASRLGWLGTAERFVENSATGIIRMGVRLYDPNLGRFLSTDPIEGGSANGYEYAGGDPVNRDDLDGTRWIYRGTRAIGPRITYYKTGFRRISPVFYGICCEFVPLGAGRFWLERETRYSYQIFAQDWTWVPDCWGPCMYQPRNYTFYYYTVYREEFTRFFCMCITWTGYATRTFTWRNRGPEAIYAAWL